MNPGTDEPNNRVPPRRPRLKQPVEDYEFTQDHGTIDYDSAKRRVREGVEQRNLTILFGLAIGIILGIVLGIVF